MRDEECRSGCAKFRGWGEVQVREFEQRERESAPEHCFGIGLTVRQPAHGFERLLTQFVILGCELHPSPQRRTGVQLLESCQRFVAALFALFPRLVRNNLTRRLSALRPVSLPGEHGRQRCDGNRGQYDPQGQGGTGGRYAQVAATIRIKGAEQGIAGGQRTVRSSIR